MTSPARLIAAAVLTASLAVPAISQASGLPNPRPATPSGSASAFHAADLLAAGPADWLLKLFQQLWTKAGSGISPNGPGASGATGPTGDAGPVIDPNGGKASHPSTGRPYGGSHLQPIAN